MSLHLVTEPEPRPVRRLRGWQLALGWALLIALTLPWWVGVYVLTTWAI